MNPTCQSSREALAGNDLPTFEAHASGCNECTAYALRLARIERTLGELPRVAAPETLNGRVVAALEAGHREDRVLRALVGLVRVEVPEHLDAAVARQASPAVARSLSAPDVLRRLVEEELSDPSKARARRFVGSLERVQAPAELAARLDDALSAPRVAQRSWTLRARLFASAAALVLVTSAVAILWSVREDTRKPRIQWVHVDSTDELSPFAVALVAGLSGGVTDVASRGGAR
ncbi:MAG: hypothetical protein K8S98_02435 [Planctomycetes bacterium]|nr:hypothetical protein [Planctomycetota bacterium]